MFIFSKTILNTTNNAIMLNIVVVTESLFSIYYVFWQKSFCIFESISSDFSCIRNGTITDFTLFKYPIIGPTMSKHQETTLSR